MYDNDPEVSARIDPDWSVVAVGTPVLTIDGQALGTVVERRSDGLLVRGAGAQGEDYLVTAADIGRIEKDGVHLMVTEAQAMRAQATESAFEVPAPDGQNAPKGETQQ